MATQVPPLKGAAFSFEVSLTSQADTDIFKTSVTLAAGDVTVSKDGGSFSNITTLPTEISTSGVLTVALSSTEMNADRVAVRFHDAAGDEWQDKLVVIMTASQQVDDLAVAGDEMDLVDAPNAAAVAAIQAGLSTYDGSDTSGVTELLTRLPDAAPGAQGGLPVLDINSLLPANVVRWDDNPMSGTLPALQGADGDTLETLSDQIDGISACGAGSGAVSYPITVNNESSNPIDGVEVWITTDSAGTNVVAGTLSTDASGIVTFMLDAGSYYVWRQKSGYNFTNPVAITVT